MQNRFRIRKGEKVLDIGCGARPFPFATHLADVSLTDDSQRFGLPILLTRLPVYQCSVESMPFEDNEFDFIYCAHVLEHIEDPAAACKELMRVGERGYIECPRSWIEYAFHSEHHRWIVDHERNCLIFREKLDEEKEDHLGVRYSIFSWLRNKAFRDYWNSPEVKALRNVEFYWEEKFDFVVIPKWERKNAGVYEWFYSGRNSGAARERHSDLRRFLHNELRRALKRQV